MTIIFILSILKILIVHFDLGNKSDEYSKIHTVKITISTIQYSIFRKNKTLTF